MLRIIDARTGEPVDAVPTRRGLTRVEVHAPGHDTSALRVLLVADTLVRALELGGTPVRALLSGDRERPEPSAMAALGIRPFETGPETVAGPREAQVIQVTGENTTTAGGIRVSVAPVDPVDPADPVGLTAGGTGGATDPAVVRLALLTPGRTQLLRLDAQALTAARDTLERWRRAVAGWARQPSRAIPGEVHGRLRAAWEDDLDVPGVLGVLRWVETSDLPEGARFETYAYADRLLGLELVRDVGSPV